MGFIKRALRGEEKLWKVFWICGFVVPVIAGLLLGIVLSLLPLLAIPFGLLWLAYIIWWLVATWRCAYNAEAKIWGHLARVYTLLGPVLVVVGLLVGGVLVGQDLITAAECRKQMNEEAAVQGVDPKAYAHKHVNECLKAKGSEMRLNRTPEGATPESITACEAIFKAEATKRNQDPGAFRALHGDAFQKCVFEQMRTAAGTPASPLIRISLPPEIAQNPATPGCIDQLKAHAEKNGVADVKAYVTQNNKWVIQCVKQAKVQP